MKTANYSSWKGLNVYANLPTIRIGRTKLFKRTKDIYAVTKPLEKVAKSPVKYEIKQNMHSPESDLELKDEYWE